MPLQVPGSGRARRPGSAPAVLSPPPSAAPAPRAAPVPRAAPAPRLEVEGLTRRYGPILALDDVSFTVEPGELLVVVGPNGAGKTTLVRVLARLARAAAGRVRLDGEDWLGAPADRQREVGVVSHATWLYDGLTAAENLRFYATLYGLEDRDRRAGAALEAAGLEDLADRPAATLSRGQAQRLSIARAILHEPRLLLLDEPFAGLDPGAVRRLADRLTALAAGRRTILLTTHDLARVPRAANRWLILVGGRVRQAGACAGLAPGALEAIYESAVAREDDSAVDRGHEAAPRERA